MMFRQRAGRVNWKRLTSLDYDALLHDRDGETVGELNACIDNLTFALFTARDVEGNSCEAVVLFARVMQLIVEYLLCSQEKQAKTLVETVSRNKQMKRRNHATVRELESMREETKVYKKQLAMLRSHGFDPAAAAKRYQYVMGAAPSEKGDSSLLLSFLSHEESTRAFMKGLLEGQRAAFAKEAATMGQRNDPNASEGSELQALRDRVSQLEAREQRLQQSAGDNDRERRVEHQQSEVFAEQERQSRLLRDRERQLEASLREANEAKQRAEIALMARTEALSSLEADLRKREESLRSREQEAVTAARISPRSSAASFPERLLFSQMELRSKLAAARAVFGLLKRGAISLSTTESAILTWAGCLASERRAFASWTRLLRDIKAAGADAAVRGLEFELDRLRAREGELLSQLRDEQKRVVLEQAKFGFLARKAESASSTMTAQ